MAALELHQRTPIKSKGHEVVGPVEDDGIAGGAVDKDGLGTHDKDVVATRTGAVLGAFSILKEDNFPGMQSSKIAQTIPGASNFRCGCFDLAPWKQLLRGRLLACLYVGVCACVYG
eukprot:1138848-Pelagomonas_calceolata.AAC.8